MSIIYTAIVLCALGLIGAKAEFKIYYEDLTIEAVDPEYLDPETTTAFVNEDNQIATNFSLVKTLSADTKCHYQIFGSSMGRYIIPTGINLLMKFCDMPKEPIVLGPFFTAAGFTQESCPPEPGNYIQPGFSIPLESLPDDFPENRYRAAFEFVLERKPIFSCNVYFETQN